MKTEHYFTFGQQYDGTNHPLYPKAHRDGWVTIVAENHQIAREKGWELFGSQFSTSYENDSHWEPHWFPMGEIERFEV
jgi:hypothetical protein